MRGTQTSPHKGMQLVKSLRVWFRYRGAAIPYSYLIMDSLNYIL